LGGERLLDKWDFGLATGRAKGKEKRGLKKGEMGGTGTLLQREGTKESQTGFEGNESGERGRGAGPEFRNERFIRSKRREREKSFSLKKEAKSHGYGHKKAENPGKTSRWKDEVRKVLKKKKTELGARGQEGGEKREGKGKLGD